VWPVDVASSAYDPRVRRAWVAARAAHPRRSLSRAVQRPPTTSTSTTARTTITVQITGGKPVGGIHGLQIAELTVK
jgi:hypothetical protein